MFLSFLVFSSLLTILLIGIVIYWTIRNEYYVRDFAPFIESFDDNQQMENGDLFLKDIKLVEVKNDEVKNDEDTQKEVIIDKANQEEKSNNCLLKSFTYDCLQENFINSISMTQFTNGYFTNTILPVDPNFYSLIVRNQLFDNFDNNTISSTSETVYTKVLEEKITNQAINYGLSLSYCLLNKHLSLLYKKGLLKEIYPELSTDKIQILPNNDYEFSFDFIFCPEITDIDNVENATTILQNMMSKIRPCFYFYVKPKKCKKNKSIITESKQTNQDEKKLNQIKKIVGKVSETSVRFGFQNKCFII